MREFQKNVLLSYIELAKEAIINDDFITALNYLEMACGIISEM